MDIGDLYLALDEEERHQRERKKRNAAFRRRLEREKTARKEKLHAKLMTVTAVLACIFGAVLCFR